MLQGQVKKALRLRFVDNANDIAGKHDILKIQKNIGAGGPTQIDMDTWREMICSKSYGNLSPMLANEIATLDRRLAMDNIPHDYI